MFQTGQVFATNGSQTRRGNLVIVRVFISFFSGLTSTVVGLFAKHNSPAFSFFQGCLFRERGGLGVRYVGFFHGLMDDYHLPFLFLLCVRVVVSESLSVSRICTEIGSTLLSSTSLCSLKDRSFVPTQCSSVS